MKKELLLGKSVKLIDKMKSIIENINNDYSILKFDEIYKLYFELFSSTLC